MSNESSQSPYAVEEPEDKAHDEQDSFRDDPSTYYKALPAPEPKPETKSEPKPESPTQYQPTQARSSPHETYETNTPTASSHEPGDSYYPPSHSGSTSYAKASHPEEDYDSKRDWEYDREYDQRYGKYDSHRRSSTPTLGSQEDRLRARFDPVRSTSGRRGSEHGHMSNSSRTTSSYAPDRIVPYSYVPAPARRTTTASPISQSNREWMASRAQELENERVREDIAARRRQSEREGEIDVHYRLVTSTTTHSISGYPTPYYHIERASSRRRSRTGSASTSSMAFHYSEPSTYRYRKTKTHSER